MPVDYAYRINEVFMQVIHKFSDTVFQRRRHPQIVEDCQVLDALAKADAAGMRADGDIELGSHEEYGEVFIDPGQAAAVNLTHVDGPCLHQLLEHYAIVAVFAGGDAHGHLPPDAGVSENIVRTGGLFHPPGINFSKLLRALDGFIHVPFLIGIHHQLVGGSNFFTNQACPTQIVGWISSNLQFEMGPALTKTFAAQAPNLVVTKTKPAYRSGVGRIAKSLQGREA